MAQSISRQRMTMLEDAHAAATLEQARFIKPGAPAFIGGAEYTAEVAEATRIYRQTWILAPLEHVMRELGSEKFNSDTECSFCGAFH